MTLDPISGEIVHTTLAAIERELFEADWAAAKERLGREPMILDLERTPAQRRADALVEMATRARTAPARRSPSGAAVLGARRLRDLRRSRCSSSSTAPCSPRARSLRWLTEADIERVVFDGPSRVHRRRCRAALLPRCAQARHRAARPHLLPPELRRAPDLPPDRPHRRSSARAAPPPRPTVASPAPSTTAGATTTPTSEWDHGTPDIGDPDAGPDPPDAG